MIKLRKSFTKKKLEFDELYRDDTMIIYTVRQHFENDKTGVWLEIFKPVVRKPNIYHNDNYEVYPCDEDFGTWAWSCSDVESLERICKEKFGKPMPMEISSFSLGVSAN